MQNPFRAPFARLTATGFLAAALISPAAVCAADTSQQRWALLVGVGDNINPDNTLLGPKNDVPAVSDLLRGGYGFPSDHLKILMDAQATHAQILAGWEWLIQHAKPGDLVVFYYSGHGIDIPDASKPTGRDSAICPYDARRRADLIAGAQIGTLIDRLKTDQVVVIVDACNSGSATRDLRMRRRSPNPASFGLSSLPADRTDAAAPFTGEMTAAAPPHKERYIGAARMDQSAMDYPFLATDSDKTGRGNGRTSDASDNQNMGALTYFLLQELRADPERKLTYDALVQRVRRDLTKQFANEAQEPQESGPALDSTPFLAVPTALATVGTPVARKRPLPVAIPTSTQAAEKGQSLTLRALAGATLTPGSILETTGGRRWNEIESGEADNGGPVAAKGEGLVKIISVTGTTAKAFVLTGTIPVGAPLAEALSPIPDDRLRVALAVEGPLGDRLRAALSAIDHVEIVPATRPSDVTLYASETLSGGVDPYRGGIALPALAEEAVPTLIANLQGVKPLANLENPPANSTRPIHVRVQGNGGKEGYIAARIGGAVNITITVDQTCYITFVDLAPDGTITGATLPTRFAANVPSAPLVFPVTGPAGLDTVKVIATPFKPAIPIPGNATIAAQMGDAGKPSAVAHSILDALRVQVNEHAGTKGIDFSLLSSPNGGQQPAPIATDGWAITDLLLRIDPAE